MPSALRAVPRSDSTPSTAIRRPRWSPVDRVRSVYSQVWARRPPCDEQLGRRKASKSSGSMTRDGPRVVGEESALTTANGRSSSGIGPMALMSHGPAQSKAVSPSCSLPERGCPVSCEPARLSPTFKTSFKGRRRHRPIGIIGPSIQPEDERYKRLQCSKLSVYVLRPCLCCCCLCSHVLCRLLLGILHL